MRSTACPDATAGVPAAGMPPFDPLGGYDVTEADVRYGGPPEQHLLARVYRPASVPGPWPALIDVHGGAWAHFDRTADAHFDRALAVCGMVVVALDFRQAPTRYPTAVADVVAGIRFVKANAARLDVAPAPLGLIGGSSGGHLLLLAALRPDAPEFGTTPYVGQTPVRLDARVAYALALWPIADPLARYRYVLDRIANPRPSRERFFVPERLKAGHEGFFGDEATMRLASVPRLLADGEAQHLPSLWIAHPELDENVTREMSDELEAAYRGAGGSVELVVFPGAGHAFANVPGPAAEPCIAAMRAFVAARLGAA
jgi:acetyl esterase